MSKNLYIVFSAPPAGVSWDDYNAWYERHAVENVQSEAFRSVTRYAVEPIVVGKRKGPRSFEHDTEAAPYNYAAVYEFEGDISSARADLLHRVERGEIYLPEWFNEVNWMTWNCVPLAETVRPARVST